MLREIHLSFRNSLLVKIGCWGRKLIPIFSPPVRIMFINILCFLTKNFELEENVVLLEVLYRNVDCVDIYDFIHLLTYYQLCINFQKKKIWRWIVFKYCGGFLCVFIKPKIWFIWWRKCLNRWNLFLFFPPFSLRVLCFFFLYLIWKPLVTIQMIIIIVMLLTFIGCSTVF